MAINFKKGDRVIVHNSEYNPLTDFYIEEVGDSEINLKFAYGIMEGFTSIQKSKIEKHPIQKSQFTFSISINGNECNANNPEINDFSKDLLKMNNQNLIFRAVLISLKRILQSFTDHQSKIEAIDVLTEIINSDDPLNNLNSWIVPMIESLPEDFNCKSVLEYSGENVPVTAMYTSERPNDNRVTAIFLTLFCVVNNQIGALGKDTIMTELKIN